MPTTTLHDQVNSALRGKLDRELVKRRERGDTMEDIAFWLRGATPFTPSVAVVRIWCNLALARASRT